jgi:DNA-binding LacI/PurR family transcriptional regulator
MKETQSHNTILDLAAALQLSPATVSRALSNTSYVKKETKQRVLDMAQKLGYRKNTLASGLRKSKTNTIGLILPKISMYFHSAVVTVVQNLLHAEGYNLIIGQSNDDPVMEKELVDTFFSSRVDALIVSCTLHTTDFSPFDIFKNHQVPVLFYDRVPPEHYQARVIKGDDYHGGYLAGSALAEAGCKKIAMICGILSANLYQGRSAGFLQALDDHQLKIDGDMIFYQHLNPHHTELALTQMFDGKDKPDGIFVTSDRNAIAVLSFAAAHNIRIPQDLKVVGYSNDPITAMVTPSITTIEQFPALFGQELVNTLLQMLHEDDNTEIVAPPVITPVKLIIRNSV